MLRFIAVTSLIVFPVVAHAQPSACNDAQIVFVGRAERSVTYHISGEPAIERARQNLKRVEEEVARERAGLDFRTRMERNPEFELRLIEARLELDTRRGMYPPPYDLTFIPIQVEQAFRGVKESTVMLLDRRLPIRLEPDQRYLIVGYRPKNSIIPPLPDFAHLSHLSDYVEALRVTPAASAQREVEFLAATRTGATILGTLRRHTWGDGLAPPISGVRVLVSSGGEVVEATTKDDGTFAVSGVPAGRIEIRPVLPEDLTLFNRSASTTNLREGECRQVLLTAALNGRVRGRIVGPPRRSMKGVTVVLYSINLTDFLLNPSVDRVSAHAPRLEVAAAEDGSFEVFGAPPGTYLLIAWVRKVVDGKKTTITTFYPGTPERAAAVPVTIGNATLHEGFDFVVRTE